MQSSYALDGKLPVFAFPLEVNFYLDDKSTHKQIVTLYNPYEFPVRFKVLCTAPHKYQVINPQGSVKAKCQIDLVFRHTSLTNVNCNITDKFRIQLHDHATKQMIGKRDILATLLTGVPEVKLDEGEPSYFEKTSGDWEHLSAHQNDLISRENQASRGGSISPLILMTGLVSAIALLLPNEGEISSIPLQLSLNLKLVFAYILGLVTMVIFRS